MTMKKVIVFLLTVALALGGIGFAHAAVTASQDDLIFYPTLELGDMTALDNVKVGMHNEIKCSFFESIFRLPGYFKAEKKANEKAMEILEFMGLADIADQKAGSLPYGVQRRLEIARALASNPAIILLDEPAAGMNPSETTELMHQIRRIRDHFQIAIFLIEHDMSLVMNVCEGIVVVNYGKIIAKGTPEEIKNNPAVIEAYLGRS